jgi:uncharacterized membrane protein
MAGIGFELRKVLKRDSLLSIVKMYGYSAVLSSGSWVISIIAVLIVGFITVALTQHTEDLYHLQIIITYAFALAASLVFTGFVQLPLTRYIADLIFANRTDEVIGTFLGALFVVLGVGIALFTPAVWVLIPELSVVDRFLVSSVFVVLCAVWISNVLVSSLKYYRRILTAFFLSYGFIVAASYMWGRDLTSLLFIFFVGNAFLFIVMITLIYKSYHGARILRFDFFKHKGFYYTLAIAGLFYNLGTWVDKFIFWYHPMTGERVIGIIHSSVVYDLPIFMAYLSIIPGMAVFFYRLEADFAEKYDLFYSNVREGGTLGMIQTYRNQMVSVVRLAVKEILAVQSFVALLVYLGAPKLFAMLKIPQLYLGLFYILMVGAILQLGFMVVLAILYYLDRRTKAMWLSILFFVLNALLSWLSIYMGPEYFGYGYAVSLLIVFSLSLIIIRNTMEKLDYETFMLQ